MPSFSVINNKQLLAPIYLFLSLKQECGCLLLELLHVFESVKNYVFNSKMSFYLIDGPCVFTLFLPFKFFKEFSVCLHALSV